MGREARLDGNIINSRLANDLIILLSDMRKIQDIGSNVVNTMGPRQLAAHNCVKRWGDKLEILLANHGIIR